MTRLGLVLIIVLAVVGAASAQDVFDRVEHSYADNDGVRIHYASLGEGPLVVMIHGFPDFWYTWRDQMAALSSEYHVVAVDLRGYNRSDKPDGVAAYAMLNHLADIAAVIQHTGEESATIVGHDWGGAVAWSFALTHPEMTDKLVILNLPHPNGLARELRTNPQQYENSAYARTFQEKDPDDPTVLFGRPMTPETLAFWVTDPDARALRRGVRAVGLRGDAQYVQGQLSRRQTGRRPAAARPEGDDAGADVSRSQRHRAALGRTQQHLGLAREGSDPRHRAGRRSLRAAGRERACHDDDAVVDRPVGRCGSRRELRSVRHRRLVIPDQQPLVPPPAQLAPEPPPDVQEQHVPPASIGSTANR